MIHTEVLHKHHTSVQGKPSNTHHHTARIAIEGSITRPGNYNYLYFHEKKIAGANKKRLVDSLKIYDLVSIAYGNQANWSR